MSKKFLFPLLACCAITFAGSTIAFAEEATAEEVFETATDDDASLSDDIYSFQLKLDGEVYQFPMSYEDFLAYGWTYLGDESEELSPNNYSPAERFKKGELEAYVSLINLTINTLPLTECTVGGFSVDSWQFEKAPETTIELPKGITYGVSTLEDVKAAYGEPSDSYDGELYTSLTYRYESYRDIDLYIDKETGVLNEVEVRNFIEDESANEEAASQVSSDPTPEVLAYTAPEELGDDPLAFTVEFAGDLYQLPAPVSVFVENGWTIKTESSESVVAGKNSGWVSMMKDNQEFRTLAYNYHKNATTIENCFVTSVDSDIYSPNLTILAPGGFTVGMTGEELLAALENFSYTTDESSDTYTYYHIESPESSLDRVDIVLNKEENQVITVEVRYSPRSLS